MGRGKTTPLPCCFTQKEDVIKILALDQSTKITGYSVWENKKLIGYGLLNSNIKENNPLERMRIMGSLISEKVEELCPDVVVIEGVQFQNNYRTYSQLSQMQGVIFNVLFTRNLAFRLIEPTAWKSYSKIKGKKRVEQKENTILMVRNKFNIDVSEDEADAIGIGIWAINNIDDKELLN